MRAGLLKEKIEILRASIVKNSMGEDIETWNTVYTTRAKVENVSSNIETVNSELTYSYTKRFEVRFYVPIEDFDRLVWRGKIYRVISIDKDKPLMRTIINAELLLKPNDDD